MAFQRDPEGRVADSPLEPLLPAVHPPDMSHIRHIVEDFQQLTGQGIDTDDLELIYTEIKKLETDAALLKLWHQRDIGAKLNEDREVVWVAMDPFGK